MILLLLLASLSWSQSSTDTDKGTTLFQEMRLSNVSKDVGEMRTGRPNITGIPRFIKGICFNQAGTDCQTTASSGGPGLTSTQTWTARNTFSTYTYVGSASGNSAMLNVYGTIASSTTIGSLSCDTASTLSANSNDVHGSFTCANGASKCTYSFSKARKIAPDCVCYPEANNRIWKSISSTTGILCDDNGINCNGEIVHWHCDFFPE